MPNLLHLLIVPMAHPWRWLRVCLYFRENERNLPARSPEGVAGRLGRRAVSDVSSPASSVAGSVWSKRMTMNVKPFALAMIAAFATTPVVATGALAADLTSYSEPPSYEEPAATNSGWGGAYVGADLGMSSRKLSPFDGDKGLVVGAHAGYNVDLDSGVVGGEIEASHLGNVKTRVPGGNIREQGRVAAKAKAGIGVNQNQTLVYGTAGVALTSFDDRGGTDGPDGWKPGWLVGAGVEHKLSDNVSARFEYNYARTNDVRSTTAGATSRTDIRDHVLKAGVNYHF